MASKSTLDPDNFPIGTKRTTTQKGRDIRTLGPSDSSDSGSDLAGALPNADNEIHLERGADEDALGGHVNDIDTDRIVGSEEAGLGGGLDQAEEARLGMRDDAESGGLSGERRRRIAEAAYYRAERRGFASGSEYDDWLEAEQEIDAESDSAR
jgi:hypothetical protein